MVRNYAESNHHLGYHIGEFWINLVDLLTYVVKAPAGVIQYLARGQEAPSWKGLIVFKWVCAVMSALLYTILAFIGFDFVSNLTITKPLLFVTLIPILLLLTYCKFCIDINDDEDDWE